MSEWSEIPTVYTRLRFRSEGELPTLFRCGDGVSISGAGPADVNGEKIICAIGGGEGVLDYVVVTGLLEQAVTQTEGSVRIERSVPEMDYVIECQNRLWGCRYGTENGKSLNEIYCCALGDFKNWRQYMGLSTDSWTASVGSDGPWTGAVRECDFCVDFEANAGCRRVGHGGAQICGIGDDEPCVCLCGGENGCCDGDWQAHCRKFYHNCAFCDTRQRSDSGIGVDLI